MHRYLLLIVPGLVALVALQTGWLAFKVGVPGCCAVILALQMPGAPPNARSQVVAVMWAFVFSMIGDAFLSNRRGHPHFFELGIGGFFLAHLGYLAYALLNGRLHRPTLLLLLAVFVPYHVGVLAPAISGAVLEGAVFAYLLISCVVWAAAFGLHQTGPTKALYEIGIGLVVFSDTIISFKEFLGYDALNRLILPTYYLAHLVITTSLLVRFTPARVQSPPASSPSSQGACAE